MFHEMPLTLALDSTTQSSDDVRPNTLPLEAPADHTGTGSTAGRTGTPTTQSQSTGTGSSGGGSSISPIIIMVLVVGIFFIFTTRSQGREKKKRAALLSAIKKGDKVQTIGGVLGSVVEVRDDEVVLKVDENSNTRIRFTRGAIQTILTDKSEKTE